MDEGSLNPQKSPEQCRIRGSPYLIIGEIKLKIESLAKLHF
jgi:hypothetical protein